MVSIRRIDFHTVVEEMAVHCSGDETEQNDSCDGAKAGTLRASGTETGPQDQGEAMSNWHDTPPTKAGYYWVKSRRSGQEWIAERTRHGVWDRITGEVAVAAEDGEAAELVQFGHRIPTNDELAELPGLIELYACKRMNQAEAEATYEWGDRATFENQAAGYKAKINAILG